MKHAKKLTALMLCLLLAFGMILPVSASKDPVEEPMWAISEDLGMLTYGDTSYTCMEIPYDTWFRPYAIYTYSQTIRSAKLSKYSVYVSHPMNEAGEVRKDLVFLYRYTQKDGWNGVYVTESSRKIIEDFCAGKYAHYELGNENQSAPLAADAVEAWRNATPEVSIDTLSLAEVPFHYVLGYDESYSLASVQGVIFEVEGEYLYVSSEHCTSIFGVLSLRPGSVPALALDGQHAEAVKTAIKESSYFSTDVTYESSEPLPPVASMVIFLIMASPVMFLLPALLLTLGIVMRCVKKVPNRKRWKAVIITASVWLGGAVIAALLLVIPTLFL